MTREVKVCECLSFMPNLPLLATHKFASEHFTSMSTRKFLLSHPMNHREVEELIFGFKRDYLFHACEHEMRRANFGRNMAPLSYNKQQLASLVLLSRWFIKRHQTSRAMIASWKPIKPIITRYVCPDVEQIIILYCGVVSESHRERFLPLLWCV